MTRPEWLRVLALAPFDLLARCAAELPPLPPFTHVRAPEIGLAMVRGRAGGDGATFNLGEMTVVRCSVRVHVADDDEPVGFGCVAGRSTRHAELVAVYDALLQSERHRAMVIAHVITPAAQAIAERRAQSAQRRAATTADFVTVARSGEA